MNKLDRFRFTWQASDYAHVWPPQKDDEYVGDFFRELEELQREGRGPRQVFDFGAHRDTGTICAGLRLFQNKDSGHLYWAESIYGRQADWVMKHDHRAGCTGWGEPTPFSLGRMQRCACPMSAHKAGERWASYPKGSYKPAE